MNQKIFHFIWFGNNPLTPLTEQCIASWHKHMPDWRFMRWDESNFDIAAAPLYVRQAYADKFYSYIDNFAFLHDSKLAERITKGFYAEEDEIEQRPLTKF